MSFVNGRYCINYKMIFIIGIIFVYLIFNVYIMFSFYGMLNNIKYYKIILCIL